MDLHRILLILHLLGATIWTGGHIILSISVLPKALRSRSISDLQQFEANFERVGIPALILQVITGIGLSHLVLPDMAQWFTFGNPVSQLIILKLALLAATILLAIDARLRLIPKLNEKNLNALAYHIIPVTLISIAFVVLGASLRTGWF